MFRKSDAPTLTGSKISNILGPDTSYKGILKSDGNVRVDGVFEGLIETAGNVVIGPSAKVLADIIAGSVQVWGAVRGNITAQGRLEILSTGRVWGDVKVSSMLIDEGGMFRGQCLMMAEDMEPPALCGEQETEPRPDKATEPTSSDNSALQESTEGAAGSVSFTQQPTPPSADVEMSVQSTPAKGSVSRSRRKLSSPSTERGAS